MKTVWISRPSERVNGSMVVWLVRREAAAYLLQKITVIFGPTAGFAAPYQPRENSNPCINCNSYGHYQAKCNKPARCGHCSDNHQSGDCADKVNPRCPACSGPHSIMDRWCPVNPKTPAIEHKETKSRGEVNRPQPNVRTTYRNITGQCRGPAGPHPEYIKRQGNSYLRCNVHIRAIHLP